MLGFGQACISRYLYYSKLIIQHFFTDILYIEIQLRQSIKRKILKHVKEYNIRVICDKWKVCEKQLWNKWKNASFCIFSNQNMIECENNVQMVKELTNGIIGFNDGEIRDILDYVTTMY